MKMRGLTIKLNTLTPIWTGNAFGKCDEIKESSILGCLRWWYEAINRGLGRKVCSPISDDRNKSAKKCKVNSEKFADSILKGKTTEEALDEQDICPVCKLFGCNGWSGKIQLIIQDYGGQDIEYALIDARRNKTKKGMPFRRKTEGKMFNKNNFLELQFYPLKHVTDEEWILLDLTLKVISKWTALGARTSQGNGVVNIKNSLQDSGSDLTISLVSRKNNDSRDEYPSLDNFFFSKFWLEFDEEISSLIDNNLFWTGDVGVSNSKRWKGLWEKYCFVPTAFHIRDTIRRMEENNEIRHRLFGKASRGFKSGSKIFVSHGYKVADKDDKTMEFRIWGYNVEKDRNLFMHQLIKHLEDNILENLFINGATNKVYCNLNDSIYGEELLRNFLRR